LLLQRLGALAFPFELPAKRIRVRVRLVQRRRERILLVRLRAELLRLAADQLSVTAFSSGDHLPVVHPAH